MCHTLFRFRRFFADRKERRPGSCRDYEAQLPSGQLGARFGRGASTRNTLQAGGRLGQRHADRVDLAQAHLDEQARVTDVIRILQCVFQLLDCTRKLEFIAEWLEI